VKSIHSEIKEHMTKTEKDTQHSKLLATGIGLWSVGPMRFGWWIVCMGGAAGEGCGGHLRGHS
jgi:hypothetical protein